MSREVLPTPDCPIRADSRPCSLDLRSSRPRPVTVLVSTAVAELARVLRPGGRLIYAVVHPSGGAKGWARTFEVSGRLCAIDGYWHAVAEHRSACAAAGLAISSWVEPHLDGSADPVALVVEATR